MNKFIVSLLILSSSVAMAKKADQNALLTANFLRDPVVADCINREERNFNGRLEIIEVNTLKADDEGKTVNATIKAIYASGPVIMGHAKFIVKGAVDGLDITYKCESVQVK